MTPLFGCFCPGSDQKKCERIYSFIYNNTCVGECDGNKQKIDFSPHWGATTFIYSYLYCHGNYIRSPVVVVVVPFCRVPIRLSRRRLLFFFLFPPFSFHLVFDCSLIALRWKQTRRVETRRLCKARSESNQELFDVFHYKFFYIFTTDRIDVGCALFMSCVVHFRTHPETAQKPHQSTEKERKKKKKTISFFFLHIYVHCNEFFQKYLFSSTYRRRCICCSVCSFYLLLLLRYLMFLKKAPFVYIYRHWL